MKNITRIQSAVISGYKTQFVTVEALKVRGLSQLILTGLPDLYLRDSRDKIRVLLSQNNIWAPLEKVIAHIFPPEIDKGGAHLELPLAVACFVALQNSQIHEQTREDLKSLYFLGSLTLEGTIEPTQACEVIEPDLQDLCIGPKQVFRFEELSEAMIHGTLKSFLKVKRVIPLRTSNALSIPDKKTRKETESVAVDGLLWEKFWISCAALCRSPVLMMGSPGIGKSTLARWASTLISAHADKRVSQDVKRIWRLAQGTLPPDGVPKIFPHPRSHISEFLGTKTKSKMIIPGFFSLAHGGVLVLDEFLEMNRDSREILRTVLETKQLLKRTPTDTSLWPADFWLLATANPCPCGLSDGYNLDQCRCTQSQLKNYQSKLSGPLWDRFGLRLFVKGHTHSASDLLLPQHIRNILSQRDSHFWIKEKIPISLENFEATQEQTQSFLKPFLLSGQISHRDFNHTTGLLSACHNLFGLDIEASFKLWTLKRSLESVHLSPFYKSA
jgi:magnesium chelatase family protein